MDAVYLCREGENPELRYSLRSLSMNVPHDTVWIFGGAPSWVNTDTVCHVRNRQSATPAASTRSHLELAIENRSVSDPFMLWDDDFFAMRPVDGVEPLHRGLISSLLEGTRVGTPWLKGARDTLHFLSKTLGIDEPFSYDLHLPIVVDKRDMREALRLAKMTKSPHVHIRSLYGNSAGLGGRATQDVKMIHARDSFPRGPWLSSGTNTYRSTVEPVLRFLFPDPCIYERTQHGGQPEGHPVLD